MGRSVTYNLEVQSQLNTQLKLKKDLIGFLIGQRIQQKDIIIFLCPVPTKTEETENVKDDSPKKSEDKDQSNDFLTQVSESWICQYSKEVSRSLCGGFDILGIYVITSIVVTDKNNSKLREILYGISRTLKKDQELRVHTDMRNEILLHVCKETFKCVCHTYDTSDLKSTPVVADWKVLNSPPRWHTLQTQLCVDLKFAIKTEDKDLTIKKQIESGLTSLYRRILNAKTLVNDSLRDADELLSGSAESKKSKQKGQALEQTFSIDLLLPFESSKVPYESQTSECIMMYTSRGVLECRAFVHGKATVAEAIKALQQDAIRSIRARCEIHCEDLLVIDGEQQDPVIVYELPKRVFAPLCGILVSDYQFPGDSVIDSQTAFKELLDLDVLEDEIQSLELSPEKRTLIQSEVNEDRLSEFGDTNSSPQRNVFLPVAGAAIAAVTAGLSYLLLWNNP